MTTNHNIASSQQPPLLSKAHSSATSTQSSGFLSPNPTPQNLSPSRFEAFKDNIELSFPKCLGPFTTQTSTIFLEIIGGRATGEDEPEEEQGDQKVHGFVYTQQGKRRTLFAAAVTPTSRPTRTCSALSTVPSLLLLPLPLSTPPSVRTSHTARMRGLKNTTPPRQDPCKMCTAYAQFRRVEVLLAAVPDMQLMCGLCEFRGVHASGRRMWSQWESSTETIQAPTLTPAPTPRPRIRLIVKKRPLEAAAGHDQMTVQMMADVQRNPKRVRRVPARLLGL